MRVLFITKGDFIDKQNEGGLACRYRNYYLLQKTAGKNNIYVCAVVPCKKENKENIKYIYDKQTLVSRYINYIGMRDGISKRTEQEIVDYISEMMDQLGEILQRKLIIKRILSFFFII